MAHRLEYYRQQADEALLHSKKCQSSDRDNWMRISAEWEKLHVSLSRTLGISSDGLQPSTVAPR